MINSYEGKKVKIKSIDNIDKLRAIQIGDEGEIESYEYGMVNIVLKTGLARGSLYCISEEQLRIIE